MAVSLLATGCGRTAIERGPDAPASKPAPYPESDAPPTRDDSFAPATLPTQRDVPAPFDLPVREPPVATGDAAMGLDAADAASEVARDVPSADLADAPAREVPEPPDVPLPRDIAGDPIKPWVDLGYSADAAALAELCARTGGRAVMWYCGGFNAYREFFDSCASDFGWCCYMNRPCRDVAVCACPNQGCFKSTYGCVGKYSGCTVGMDQTCNDDPASSAIRGQCVEGGYCLCRDFASNPTTGKCL